MKRLGNLEALRAEMRAHNVDVFFMTGSDPHQSEYASERFRTREWLTGFSGSSGKAAATLSEAGLWTDGRYFIQAAEQLRGSGFDLYKQDVAGVPGIIEWICDKIPTGGTLGFDGSAVSASEMKRIKKRLSCKNIKYASAFDPIGKLWKGRPGFPEEKIFEHPARFAGAPVKHKLGLVRAEMKNLGADFYFTPAPECVAWLLNIRGRDVFNTPVAYAFCLIGEDSATLFADLNKIDGPLERRLAEDGIELRGYGEAEKSLRYLGNGLSLFYDAGRVSALLEESIPEGVSVKISADIIDRLKAVKNDTERANICRANAKEGAVFARVLAFIDGWAADVSRAPLYESDVRELIESFRSETDDYLCPSFDAIVAYGENAACMHYSPEGRGSEIKPGGFLLIDSGGQYLDGTTDLTRTVSLGDLTDEMRRDFTLALKGHIALATAVFLEGATGTHLDVLARSPLWARGLNYRSGTGHGIGYCLGVHEGPQSVSMRANETKLARGMLVSNEPGVYKENRYGIRTENAMFVTNCFENEDGSFLRFEIVSYCPIDWRAVETDLLTREEIEFVDSYHAVVYEKVSPLLDDAGREWLKKATLPKASSTCRG